MSRVKQFRLPDLGEGLTEGEILTWLVKPGDTVTLNQPIVEVETAKAAVEIPSPYAGVVTELFHGAGATVEVGTPIIAFDTDPSAGPLPSPALARAEGTPAPADPTAEPATAGADSGRQAVLVGYGPRTTAAKRRPRKATASAETPAAPPVAPPVEAPPPPPVPAVASNGARALAKPPVRKLARDLGVDLATVTGTGPAGSITREDIQAAVAAPATEPSVAVPSGVAVPSFGPDRERRVPIKGVRKLTAENMVASAFTAPHVTEFLTVDVTRTVKALDRLRSVRGWRDVRVSPLLLVAKAVLAAIGRYPMVNSTWDAAANEIVVKEYVNLGIAAATERGLIVPNIKDAGRLATRTLADALNDLVATA